MGRLLVVGCGDVGRRLLARLPVAFEPWVLTRRDRPDLRVQGVRLLLGDLDHPASLRRLAGLFDAVVHLAPPQPDGAQDRRTRALVQALGRGRPPRRFIYVSTTGVYGDCQGRCIDETAPARPATDRARRRVDAERVLSDWARRARVQLALLRAPGIYAADREGHPRERLLAGRPLLRPEDDVFTNHIHADDLAQACLLALWRAAPLRVFNVVDDSDRRMGEHFDLAASQLGLPKAPRLSRDELAQRLSPMQFSFMGESRRIGNARVKRELGLRLRYPMPELGW